jgi:ketosteroid isomerase-like protein
MSGEWDNPAEAPGLPGESWERMKARQQRENEDQAKYHLANLVEMYLDVWDAGDAENFERVLEKDFPNKRTRNDVRAGVLRKRGIALAQADPDHLNPAKGGNQAADDYW